MKTTPTGTAKRIKKTQESAILHQEPKATEKGSKEEKWSSPGKSTPTNCPLPNDQP